MLFRSDVLASKFKNKLDDFKISMDTIQYEIDNNTVPKDSNKKPIVAVPRCNVDIGLRFIISVDEDEKGIVTREQAIIWIVTDFDPKHTTKLTDFSSAGFTTEDHLIIDVLERLADEYCEKLPEFKI